MRLVILAIMLVPCLALGAWEWSNLWSNGVWTALYLPVAILVWEWLLPKLDKPEANSTIQLIFNAIGGLIGMAKKPK